MTEDTNKLIKDVAYDIISITTLWGLGSTYHHSLAPYNFFVGTKYFKFSISLQQTIQLVAMGCSAFVLTKYFRNYGYTALVDSPPLIF